MSESKKDKAVIVFAKLPVKGKVKTRLANDVGNEFATAFYKVCAEHTFSEISQLVTKGIVPFLFCDQ